MASYHGISPEQRKAYFARMKGRGTPRSTDLALGAAGAFVPLGAGVGPVAGGRLVRRVTEKQYSTAERIARRGTAGDRVKDTLKQGGGYLAGALVGTGVGRLVGGGIGQMAGSYAGAAAGFALTRRHVNKLRNKRLQEAGGTPRTWTGKVKRIKG